MPSFSRALDVLGPMEMTSQSLNRGANLLSKCFLHYSTSVDEPKITGTPGPTDSSSLLNSLSSPV